MSRRIDALRPARSLVASCCVALMLPAAARAQSSAAASSPPSIMFQSRPALVVAPPPSDGRSTRTISTASESERKTHRALTGALIGAAIGSATLGGLELHHAAHCDDCFFQGPAVTLAFAAGAVGGGLLGWLFASASQ